jgi:cytochrome P450 family 109
MSAGMQKEISRSILDMEMQKEVSRSILDQELSDSSTESRVVWFQHMQETQPIRDRPEYNLWEVFRYKDVQQVLLDYTTFSVDKCLPEAFPCALGKSDPPEHRQIRSLVSKAFSPRRIEELRLRIGQIVDELLEQVSASEKPNLVTQLADPLPGRIIAEMLGLPRQDQERFQRWSNQLIGQMLGITNPDNTELITYFSDLLDERKRDPRDDLMSALLAAEENGTHLTRATILDMCLELMTAGHPTTTRLLSYAFQRFSQHPEIYQALRDDPSLIPGAIEETLRYDFALDMWRTARYDTVLDGHEIKAGQYVIAWTGAANFDKTYFPHASQFDIRRSPNPHLTFGHGAHVCLGHSLARLEARIALERVVARFSEIALNPEVQITDQILSKPIQFLDMLLGASGFPKS